MAVSESSSSWGSAVAIQVPGSPTKATLNQVECPTVGTCVALGTVKGSKPIVASLSAGTWSSTEELLEPLGATELGFIANALSCGGAGSCVVGGYYEEAGGTNRPAVAEETAGDWGTVTAIPFPAEASSSKHAGISSVSCTGTGACNAVGYYEDNTGTDRAFTAEEQLGTWATAAEMPMPRTEEVSPYHLVGLKAIDCIDADSCGAIGYSFWRQTDVLKEDGVWGEASWITLPSNAQSEEAGGLYMVSCGGVGSCAAVGSYSDTEGMERAMVLSTEGETLPRYSLHVTKAGSGSGTVTSSPSDISCGVTCSAEFDDGTEVTLTATPSPGSTFTGWSGGGCSTSSTCHVSLSGNADVTATFMASEIEPGSPSAVLNPIPKSKPHKKPLKCHKGFKKRKVHGKAKCVKVKQSKRGSR